MSLGFNIPLSATPDQLKADLTAAVSAVQQAGGKMASATEVWSAELSFLNKKLDDTIARTSELAKKYGEHSTEALKSAAQAANLAVKIEQVRNKSVDLGGAIGHAARTGFNPLSNSINQLSRELPAFTYSAQTGMMAISNNIPALFDAVKGINAMNAAAKAAGQPVQSVFTQIAGALFSWNTVLSVGVTLVTVYGKEIGEMVNNLFSAKKATDENTFSTQNYIEKLMIAMQILKDRKTFGVGADVLKSIETAKEQIKQLELQVTLKKLGITTEQYSLQQAKEKLKNLEDQQAADKKLMAGRMFLTLEASDEERAAEDRLKVSHNQIEAQKVLVKQLQHQVNLQTELARPKTEIQKAAVPVRIEPLGLEKELDRAFIQSQQNIMSRMKPISVDNFLTVPPVSKFQLFLKDNYESFAAFSQQMKALAFQAAGDLAFGIGQMLAGGDWGKTFKAQLAQLMSQTASALIALGSSLFLVNPAVGAAMVAGGLGLKIAAGVLSQQASDGGGSPQMTAPVSSYSPSLIGNGGNGYGSTGYGQGTITDRIYGGDLLLIIDQAGRVKRR